MSDIYFFFGIQIVAIVYIGFLEICLWYFNSNKMTTKKTCGEKEAAHIFVDMREQALLDALVRASVSATSKQLDIGDVQIVSTDGTRTLFVELKTVADLSASIMDGRHASQRSRLVAERQTNGASLAYIVRSTAPLCDAAQRVTSAIASLIARYQIAVIRSSSVDETAHLVATLAQQVERPPPEDAALQSTYVAQGSLVHACKKKNVMADNHAWVAMLSCVPGVSARTAMHIAQSGFKCAADALKCDRAEALRVLSEVNVPIRTSLLRTPRQKRIGEVTAARILAALYGEPMVMMASSTTQKKRKRDATEGEKQPST